MMRCLDASICPGHWLPPVRHRARGCSSRTKLGSFSARSQQAVASWAHCVTGSADVATACTARAGAGSRGPHVRGAARRGGALCRAGGAACGRLRGLLWRICQGCTRGASSSRRHVRRAQRQPRSSGRGGRRDGGRLDAAAVGGGPQLRRGRRLRPGRHRRGRPRLRLPAVRAHAAPASYCLLRLPCLRMGSSCTATARMSPLQSWHLNCLQPALHAKVV